MPLDTDRGGSDLSREGKQAGCQSEAGVPGAGIKHSCASDVWQELGARPQEIPRKGKEFNFLTQCLSRAP